MGRKICNNDTLNFTYINILHLLYHLLLIFPYLSNGMVNIFVHKYSFVFLVIDVVPIFFRAMIMWSKDFKSLT